MRKSLLFLLLGVALLVTPSAFFSTKSDAANPFRQDAPAAGNRPAPLPNSTSDSRAATSSTTRS
jgi:hypothetical protein